MTNIENDLQEPAIVYKRGDWPGINTTHQTLREALMDISRRSDSDQRQTEIKIKGKTLRYEDFSALI